LDNSRGLRNLLVMRRAAHARSFARAILALSFALTGCVTATKYKMAKQDGPRAQAFGWTVATPSAELSLATVVIYKGPGSWKREARWDEYVVRISNRGAQTLTIASAVLIDVLGQPQSPGDEPWALEKRSSSNWDRYGETGLNVVLGAGTAIVLGAAADAAAAGAMWVGPAAGGTAFFTTVLPLVFVANVTTVAVLNHSNKGKVEAEFDRRRLKLPVMIAPGASAEGSFFFPMTPGPQSLVVKGRSSDTPVELVLDLKPLAGLHLDSAKKR
jgi:hypothetical protein